MQPYKICPSCGEAAPAQAAFCGKCGHDYRTRLGLSPHNTPTGTPQAKICPRCGQLAPLDAPRCQKCGHTYRTQFGISQQAQAPPYSAPPQKPFTAGQQTGTGHYYMVEPRKSYLWPSVVVLLLYFFFWLPGFIVNILFLIDAANYRRRLGRRGEYEHWLYVLLWVCGIFIPFLALLLWLAVFLGTMSRMMSHMN